MRTQLRGWVGGVHIYRESVRRVPIKGKFNLYSTLFTGLFTQISGNTCFPYPSPGFASPKKVAYIYLSLKRKGIINITKMDKMCTFY